MAMTMQELAKRAGVSRPVVSAVLNNSSICRVSQSTRERILQLAREMNFVPNMAARQLNGGGSSLIGMISVPAHLGLVAALQAEVTTRLQKKGFEVLVSPMDIQEDTKKMMNMFHARKVDGIIVLNSLAAIRQSNNGYIPIVYCSHNNYHGFDVGCDTELGGYLGAKHLLEHGRKRIVYLGMGFSRFDQLKYQGVCRAMAEAELKPLLPVVTQDGEEILTVLRRFRADAVLCCNDFAAASLLKFLQKKGVKVPEDLALVGFDGYSFCNYTPVSLATIIQPIQVLAEKTVELLLERMQSREEHTEVEGIQLPPLFQPGGSCGCPEFVNQEISGDSFSLLMTEPIA